MLPRQTSVRRWIALVATVPLVLAAAATTPAASADEHAADQRTADQRTESDAVVFRPNAQDLARGPVDHAPADARRTDATGSLNARDAGNVIDIAFAYPAALLTQADIGGLAGLRAKFATAIDGMNQTFANSGIAATLRYVGDRQVTAPTSTDTLAMLKSLQAPGDGVFDEALALRDETHADLVSLWMSASVPLGQTCGRANLGGTQPKWDPDHSAFSVLFYTDCIDDFRVFEHELGHNFSADHDAQAALPSTEGKAYARGYTSPANGFITVMSYYDSCTAAGVRCERIPYFSSPTGTNAAGQAIGNASTDNTRAVTEQAPAVANYRQSQIYPAAPVIAGPPNRGRKLVAKTPGWAPGNVSFSYQWTADGVPIGGATGRRLKLTKGLVGTAIAVTVTGSAPHYPPVAATSAATPPIGKQLFDRTSRPRLRGIARPGRVLRAVFEAWQPSRKVSYRVTWLRNGKQILGAKARTYRVKRKDRGKRISVKVTGKRRGFEAQTRTSKKVRVRR